MVILLTSLEEIQQNSIGSKDWIKFGSKVGDPYLSVFNEDIKKIVSQIEYQPGKTYNFTDEYYQYKIDTEQSGEALKFSFFIKPKQAVKVEVKKSTGVESYFNEKNFLIGTIIFILIELLILFIGGVFATLLR